MSAGAKCVIIAEKALDLPDLENHVPLLGELGERGRALDTVSVIGFSMSTLMWALIRGRATS